MSLLDMTLQDVPAGDWPPQEDGDTHAEAVHC